MIMISVILLFFIPYKVLACIPGPWQANYYSIQKLACIGGSCGVFLGEEIFSLNHKPALIKTPKSAEAYEVFNIEISANRALKEIFADSYQDLPIVLSECDYLPSDNNDEKGIAWLSFKYYKHGDLFDYVKLRRQLQFEELRVVAFDILTALSALHRNNYIHGDVKLENIIIDEIRDTESYAGRVMVSNLARVKLIDLGFTRRTDDDVPLGLGGTLKFLSPELFEIQLKENARHFKAYNSVKKLCLEMADIWGLGYLLFRAATGKNLTPALPKDITDPEKVALFYLENLANLYREGNKGQFIARFERILNCRRYEEHYADTCLEFAQLLNCLLAAETHERCSADNALQMQFLTPIKIKRLEENL